MSADPVAAAGRTKGAARVGAAVDAVAFSGLWVATAAAALTAASAQTFGAAISPVLLGFALGGTFCVYALDRLRDLARDRHTMPLRSAFVAQHRAALTAASAVAALAAALAAVRLGGAAIAVAALAGGLGICHRRLKGVPIVKGLYVAASWMAVTLVLPARLAEPPPAAAAVAWAAAIVGPALLANAIATSARDGEAAAAVFGTHRTVRIALGLAVAGSLAGVLAPAPARHLTPIAVATSLAIAAFRSGERYERLLDGALTAGALACLL